MAFTHELRLIQTQKQRQLLSQQIALCNILAMPVTTIDLLLNSIASNPERADKLIKEKQARIKETYQESGSLDINSGAISYLPDFNEPKGEGGKSNRGIVLDFQLQGLEELIPEQTLSVVSDVLYTARKSQKPELTFGSHLVQKPQMRVMQEEFSHAGKVYKFLVRERDWINRQLVNAYVKIAEVQREFFEDLDLTKLNVYQYKDLARYLALNESTVWRLSNNRFVEIKPIEGDKVICPVNLMLPTRNDYKRHQAVEGINRVLARELEELTAYSDQEIACRISRVARRTITKYRGGAGVPDSCERRESYIKDPSRRFKITLEVEKA